MFRSPDDAPATDAPALKRLLPILLTGLLLGACSQTHEHIAEAVHEKDSLPMMSAHGISNLISDSGLISYKIVAEDWNIYTTQPQKWTFLKGLFLEKFDETFHVQWHVQADTAYCHDNRIWELRGRVVILNQEGVLFKSEEFFWDMNAHLIWSNLFVDITTPDRDLRGTRFRSNEQMTEWHFDNAAGSTPINDKANSETGNGPGNVAGTSAPGDATSTGQEQARPSQADKMKHSTPSTAGTRHINPPTNTATGTSNTGTSPANNEHTTDNTPQ